MSVLSAITRPARYDLDGTRGDSLTLVFFVRNKATGTRVSLSGYGGQSQVKDAKDGAKIADLTVVVDQSTSGPDKGKVTVTATTAQTRSFLEFGYWDCQLYVLADPDNTTKTVLAGEVHFDRDVTL